MLIHLQTSFIPTVNPETLLFLFNAFIQVSVGAFFYISGYHKLFNQSRHSALKETLVSNNIPFVSFNVWFVPFVEFTAGLTLVLNIPYIVPLAAMGLLSICLVACGTDGRKRVKAFNPINKADAIDDWLYLPEVLYSFFLIEIILSHLSNWSL